MRDRASMFSKAADIVVVQPYAMGNGKFRRQQSELGQMRHCRCTMDERCNDGLHPRFGNVHLHTDIEVIGEITAGYQEFVRAMMRNCWRERRPDRAPIEVPVLQNSPAARDGLLMRGKADAVSLLSNRCGHGLKQARYRLVERTIGHHRGNHRPHSYIIVSSRNGLDALGSRSRKFTKEIVSCRAALAHKLGPTEERRDVVYFGVAPSAEPGKSIQQQLQIPILVHTLRQADLTVGVRVDKTWNNQAIGGVYPLRIRDRRLGRNDIADTTVFDNDIRKAAERSIWQQQ